MTTASDFADGQASLAEEVAAAASLLPERPEINISNGFAEVSDDGRLHIDREVYMSSDEAIALAVWINATFA